MWQQIAGPQNHNHLKQIARDTSSAERTRNASAATMHSTCNRDAANFTMCRHERVGWGAPLKGEEREGVDGAPLTNPSPFNVFSILDRPREAIYFRAHRVTVPDPKTCNSGLDGQVQLGLATAQYCPGRHGTSPAVSAR